MRDRKCASLIGFNCSGMLFQQAFFDEKMKDSLVNWNRAGFDKELDFHLKCLKIQKPFDEGSPLYFLKMVEHSTSDRSII